MAEDMSDVVQKLSSMLQENGIPDNIKEMFNNMNTNNSDNNEQANVDSDSSANSNPFGNLDIETIMKIKTVLDKVNTKDDPRSNLLYSLKPYLNENRKGKLDQYIQMLSMTKIVDVLDFGSGGKKK